MKVVDIAYSIVWSGIEFLSLVSMAALTAAFIIALIRGCVRIIRARRGNVP